MKTLLSSLVPRKRQRGPELPALASDYDLNSIEAVQAFLSRVRREGSARYVQLDGQPPHPLIEAAAWLDKVEIESTGTWLERLPISGEWVSEREFLDARDRVTLDDLPGLQRWAEDRLGLERGAVDDHDLASLFSLASELGNLTIVHWRRDRRRS